MDTSQISDELKAKLRECTSTEELIKRAKEEGIELSDEQLEMVSGGIATGWTNL